MSAYTFSISDTNCRKGCINTDRSQSLRECNSLLRPMGQEAFTIVSTDQGVDLNRKSLSEETWKKDKEDQQSNRWGTQAPNMSLAHQAFSH